MSKPKSPPKTSHVTQARLNRNSPPTAASSSSPSEPVFANSWWPGHAGHAVLRRYPVIGGRWGFRCSCGQQLFLPASVELSQAGRRLRAVPLAFLGFGAERDNSRQTELPGFAHLLERGSYPAEAGMYLRLQGCVPIEIDIPESMDARGRGYFVRAGHLVLVMAQCRAILLAGCAPEVPETYQAAFARGVGDLMGEFGAIEFAGPVAVHLLPPSPTDIRDIPELLLVASFYTRPGRFPTAPTYLSLADNQSVVEGPRCITVDWAGPFALA